MTVLSISIYMLLTFLGDAVEVNAIKSVFSTHATSGSLALSSTKVFCVSYSYNFFSEIKKYYINISVQSKACVVKMERATKLSGTSCGFYTYTINYRMLKIVIFQFFCLLLLPLLALILPFDFLFNLLVFKNRTKKSVL